MEWNRTELKWTEHDLKEFSGTGQNVINEKILMDKLQQKKTQTMILPPLVS